MCGIVGTLSFNNSGYKIDKSLLVKMRDSLKHRGPDGKGLWISENKNVGLAHRRLSIIDPSEAASQPMSNEDKSIFISFNGEIYNHADIKKKLLKVGNYKWKTDHSDTEVILHAFEEWGIDCLKEFVGMFAISIYDLKKRELWLIRDRIGIKPLYYSINKSKINFSSEIKALLKDPLQKREVNDEAFYNYLSFLTSPSPQTLFDGIKKIPPGTWIKINHDGEIIEKKYWDALDNTKSLDNLSENEISDKIISTLKDSVEYRKISDVNVGVFLSGGIDSSINTSLFSKNENERVKAFCVKYDKNYGSYKNENYYAKSMADFVNAYYYEKELSMEDFKIFLNKMIELQDEPIADPVCMPIYFLSKLAKENNVTVCQVGEGADELFFGYPSWKNSIGLQKKINKMNFSLLYKMIYNILKYIPKINNSFQLEAIRRASISQPIFWGGAEAFSETHKNKIISNRLKKKFKKYSSWNIIKPIRERFEKKSWDKSNINWMSYLDLNLRLPELLLMRVDKMTMAVSLEGRVPFLDHKLVELAMSIPENIKLKNNDLKYILKKSVKGYIPDEIINRKKQGFNVPIHEWVLDTFGKYAKKELLEFCDQTDFLNKKEVNKLFSNDRGVQIWYLLNFVLWWKKYIK